MASFGGVELGVGGAGVFELTSESDDEEFDYHLADGSRVIFPPNSRYVVVTQCPHLTFEETHAQARRAANLALDVYHGHGGKPMFLAHKDSPYVLGWAEAGKYTLRIVGRYLMTSKLGAKVEVRDSEGSVVEQSPPQREWYESLRYYRVSESSTDLYDSFRNLYLALEAMLSRAVPPIGKTERETVWLKRALREAAHKVDLGPYAPKSQEDAASDAIHQELYVDLRTAIFHAKTGRATWAPQDWSSRPLLIEARVRYARMFRALAAEYLNTPYPGGGFFKSAWEDMIERVLARQEVFVSNDPTDIDDEPAGQHQLAPTGGDFLKLPTVAADDMASDWRRGRKGVETASAITEALGEIRRFGTLHDGQMAFLESLRAPLIAEGVDDLEIIFLVEGRNYGAPRQDFES